MPIGIRRFPRRFITARFSYTIAFLKSYSDHFFGNFLFVNGDIIERNRVPETGLLYLTDFIFLAIGGGLSTKDQRPKTRDQTGMALAHRRPRWPRL